MFSCFKKKGAHTRVEDTSLNLDDVKKEADATNADEEEDEDDNLLEVEAEEEEDEDGDAPKTEKPISVEQLEENVK